MRPVGNGSQKEYRLDDAGSKRGPQRRADRRIMTHATRNAVRSTALKVLRSDDLIAGEKEAAVAILRASPEIGNPYAVRCDWCHETKTLFRDEDDRPFKISGRGWVCELCEMPAACQEIRFWK